MNPKNPKNSIKPMNAKNPTNPANAAPSPNDEPSNALSWGIVAAIAVSFFLWGIFVYFIVGVSWPPPWRYGTIADVPGQSVYAVRGAEKGAGTAPLGEGKVRRQHIMGKGEENGKSKDKGGL